MTGLVIFSSTLAKFGLISSIHTEQLSHQHLILEPLVEQLYISQFTLKVIPTLKEAKIIDADKIVTTKKGADHSHPG